MGMGLCVVTDRKLAGGRSIVDIAEQSLEGGASVIQLREKNISSRDFLDLALGIRKVFRGYADRLFIVNDRVDIAYAGGADGVHLGQDDLPVSCARKILGRDAVIGVSVSTPSEAETAASAGADYLGAGAVFSTPTKPEAAAIGLDGLRRITSAVNIPVIAIGGINPQNLKDVMLAGASGAAVVSGVMAAYSPRDAVCEFVSIMKKLKQQP